MPHSLTGCAVCWRPQAEGACRAAIARQDTVSTERTHRFFRSREAASARRDDLSEARVAFAGSLRNAVYSLCVHERRTSEQEQAEA